MYVINGKALQCIHCTCYITHMQDGWAPLRTAVSYNRLRIVEQLLIDGRVDRDVACDVRMRVFDP